jgi:Helicase conserved C-terminal domain
LTEKLKVLYIKRNKSQVLTDELPMKNERVLFCEPSPIQKELYERMLLLPDFILLKYAQAPCECGVNRALFQQFKLLRNEREKLDFQRRKRGEIQKKWKCCWKMPMNPNYDPATCDPDEICDPMAPLWKWQHRSNSGECCKTCPFCLLFPALTKILKLSSHPSLLQLDRPPDSYAENSVDWQNAMKDLEFAKVAIPDEILRQLPGGDYVRQDGIMDQHTQLSGKMKVLAKLLKEFSRRDDRLLLFSYSTQMLDLIQNFVRSEGYSFLRLDGKTANKNRQALVDQYQADNRIFLFLISTKAGGLGLNLTAANVVIIFDVEYNPSNDEQAQDRAYRIGQMRDVLVIRLVTRGTIEELKYIRQIYKVQLKQDTIGDIEEGENKKAARMFRAVQGDKDRKGELFGIENLLRYKDGSFMDDLWKSSAVDQAKPDKKTDLDERLGLVSAEEVVQGIQNLDEDEIDDIGRKPDEWLAAHALRKDPFAYSGNEDDVARMLADGAVNHADFLQKEKGHAALEVGDVGFDEEQGGYSQVVNDVLAYAGDDGSDSDVGVAETHDTGHPSPVRSTSLRQSPEAVLSSAHALSRKARTTNPPVTARPSPAKRPRVDLPSPVRSFGASVYMVAQDPIEVVAQDPIEEDSEEEVAPTPRNKFLPAPKPQLELVIEKHTSASTQTSVAATDNGDTLDNDRAVALQRTMHNEGNGDHVPKRKIGEKSASAKVSSRVVPKAASKQRFSSKTTFSAGDLFLPSYSKKHIKSSKKS